MTELRGIGIGRGIAAGPVRRMPDPLPIPEDEEFTGDADAAIAQAQAALDEVATWLTEQGAISGGDAQGILEAQALMARDPELTKDVATRITSGASPERAVYDACLAHQRLLEGIGGYLSERAADVADVSARARAVLRGVPAPGVPESDEPFILVATDLSPADTARLDFSQVHALVTRDGGPTSHTAIVSRAKGIPAIVGVNGADTLSDGDLVIVDAGAGVVRVAATEDDIAAAQVARDAWLASAGSLTTATHAGGALKDGFAVSLLANLGSVSEVAEAVALGAEGVGLFRTEFLFLDANAAPTVAEQQAHYTELLSAFPGKKVVVRVLDAGADKPLSFMPSAHEENPALGVRGLRALRAHEQIVRDQLVALASAQRATTADLWVMAPMVADAEETDYFVSLARELGIAVAGVMAEVPALALVADQVFETADFVSIGTNDLTQYTMAADRMLGAVSSYQDPWHPAVLRLIARLAEAGAAIGKPVGVCGEAAADPQLAIVLVGLGVTSLSMVPAALAEVRATLVTVTREEARERATRALTARSAAQARSFGSS